jgi:hypothetical protein
VKRYYAGSLIEGGHIGAPYGNKNAAKPHKKGSRLQPVSAIGIRNLSDFSGKKGYYQIKFIRPTAATGPGRHIVNVTSQRTMKGSPSFKRLKRALASSGFEYAHSNSNSGAIFTPKSVAAAWRASYKKK